MNRIDRIRRITNDSRRNNETILGCCFDVDELGSGFLKKVYKNALIVVLKRLQVKEEAPFDIYFREQKIGQYVVDLLVEDQVLSN
jgi:GxxExxY protein